MAARRGARPGISDHRRALHAQQRRQEAVHVAEQPDALERSSLRIARSEQPTSVTRLARHPVARSRCAIARREPAAATTSRRSTRTPFTTSALGVQLGEQPRDVGGIVLQVGVERHGDLAAHRVEARRERRRLPVSSPSSATTRTRGSLLGDLAQALARLRSRLPSSTKTISTPPAHARRAPRRARGGASRATPPRCRRARRPRRAAAGSRCASRYASRQSRNQLPRSLPLRAAEPIVTCSRHAAQAVDHEAVHEAREAALVARIARPAGADARAAPGCSRQHLAAVGVRARTK